MSEIALNSWTVKSKFGEMSPIATLLMFIISPPSDLRRTLQETHAQAILFLVLNDQ